MEKYSRMSLKEMVSEAMRENKKGVLDFIFHEVGKAFCVELAAGDLSEYEMVAHVEKKGQEAAAQAMFAEHLHDDSPGHE